MDLLSLAVRIMCKDEASDKVGGIASNITKTMGGAAKTAAMAMGAAVTAIGGAVSAIGIQAINGYKEFEQLSGGVSKLFGTAGQSLEEYAASVGKTVDEASGEYAKLSQAEDLVMQNASNAWRTAQMDANTYMETATSFSAALINSLGGDTVKAAEMTDVAMRAISDNFNTFGGDMQNVMNAFQGFAKQNYSMLDNLKLGYGGTKAEMERLIADANEYAASIGMAADLSIDSFADVVQAIELIQEKQGIAGTAQKEALKTIEGSMNATRAAWSNFVTELGKDDADIEAVMGNLVTALTGENGEGGLLNNMATRITSIGQNIVKALPTLVSTVASAIPSIIVPIANTMVEAASELASMFWDSLVDMLTEYVPDLAGGLDLITADIELMKQRFERADIFSGLTASLQAFVDGFTSKIDVFGAIDEAMWNLEQVVQAVGDALNDPATQEALGAIGEAFGTILDVTAQLVESGLGALGEAFGELANGALPLVADGARAIADMFSRIPSAISAVGSALAPLFEAVSPLFEAVGEFVQGNGEAFEGMTERLQGHLDDLDGSLGYLSDAWDNFTEAIAPLVDRIAPLVLEFFGNLVSGVVGLLPILVELVGGFFNVAAGIANFVSTGITKIGEFVSTVQTFFTVTVPEAIDQLREAVSTKLSEVVSFFQGLPSRIVSAVGSLGSLLWEAGSSIVNGLINGAKAAWEQTKSFFTGIAGWIADHKGPIDYDRRLLVGHGQAIMQGLQEGLSDGYKDVQRLVSGMADNISMTASASLSTPYTASQGRPPIQINLSYNAGEDATQLVDDIAARLVLLGYAEG